MRNIIKNKKGAAMEMAIFYMTIIVLLGSMICMASIYAKNSVKNNEIVFENTVDKKVELDQIGDIFMNGIVNRSNEDDIQASIEDAMENSALQLHCEVKMIGYSNYESVKENEGLDDLLDKIEASLESDPTFTPKTIFGRIAKKIVDFFTGYEPEDGELTDDEKEEYAEIMSEMYNIYEMRLVDETTNEIVLDVAIKESYGIESSKINASTISSLSLDATYTVLNWSDQLLADQTTSGTTSGGVSDTFGGDASIIKATGEDDSGTGIFAQLSKFFKYTSAAIAASRAS